MEKYTDPLTGQCFVQQSDKTWRLELRPRRRSMGDDNTAQAGMAWTDIAASAYRAYAVSTGNKNYQGNPMPTWDELPQAIRTAWESAARQVGDCINGYQGDESRWLGWVPPGL
jgi:hypothetical protein